MPSYESFIRHVVGLALISGTLLLFGCREAKSPSLNELDSQLADANRTNSVVIREQPIKLGDLDRIALHTALKSLEIYNCKSSSIAPLAKLRSLEHLRINGFACNVESIELIGDLRDLRVLNIPDSELSDSHIDSLYKLEKLELLRIGSSRLTDDGLRAIAKLPSLRFLHVLRAPLTDAALQAFHDKHDLESLYIDGSRITDSGISALLAANPKLHFHRDQLHLPGDPRTDSHD